MIEHKCSNCNKDVIYDKKHGVYPKFCSKECRKLYKFNHKAHYCCICGKLAKYDGKWNRTCGNTECIRKAMQNGQKKGVKNRDKLNIQKDKLYELYITQNKGRKEVANIFGCSDANIKKILRIYNISKNQVDALKNTYNTKLKRYGNPYYTNNDIVSKTETEWLDSLGLPNDIIHRQVVLGECRVDGFDPKTNTVYEFLGDYWHGNPKLFDSNELNKHNGISMGELYMQTLNRFDTLKSMGYDVKYIWESDYKKSKLS